MLLDSWKSPGQLRIAVASWFRLAEAGDQFVSYPWSVHLLWAYVRRVGVATVLSKIRSRLLERRRNEKLAAVGTGIVLEPADGSALRPGDAVVFFAYNHPPQPTRLCIEPAFVMPAPAGSLTLIQDAPEPMTMPAALQRYVGWSPYGGIELDTVAVAEGLRDLVAQLSTEPAPEGTIDIEQQRSQVREFTPNPDRPRAGQPTAVLFGLGNYAKTQIIPNIRKHLDLVRIHEVDPHQLASFGRSTTLGLDTSPLPRDDTPYDAWFIAGYHHTHADLAIAALAQGACAVIEKPIATTVDQYARLRRAIDNAENPRYFACFHKRYSLLHDWAMRDLPGPDAPVDMHCIVYEIPVPRLHWYNWPNSGTRMVSNGCHWLDYFLYVNRYATPTDLTIAPLRGHDLRLHVRLDNGAHLTMALTDAGSCRTGVREHVELRSADVMIRMTDASDYHAEKGYRVRRRGRTNPKSAYARMYRRIAHAISQGLPGDSADTLLSSELTLQLDRMLREQRRQQTPSAAAAAPSLATPA